jgi:hypothetical protein
MVFGLLFFKNNYDDAVQVLSFFSKFDAQFESEIQIYKKIFKENVKRPKNGLTDFDRVPTLVIKLVNFKLFFPLPINYSFTALVDFNVDVINKEHLVAFYVL